MLHVWTVKEAKTATRHGDAVREALNAQALLSDPRTVPVKPRSARQIRWIPKLWRGFKARTA